MSSVLSAPYTNIAAAAAATAASSYKTSVPFQPERDAQLGRVAKQPRRCYQNQGPTAAWLLWAFAVCLNVSCCPQSHTTNAYWNKTTLRRERIQPMHATHHDDRSGQPTSFLVSVITPVVCPGSHTAAAFRSHLLYVFPKRTPFRVICSNTNLGEAVALHIRFGRDEPVEGTDALGGGEVELRSHGG